MAEVEPIWAKANDFLVRGGVKADGALGAIRDLGWTVGLLSEGLEAGERIESADSIEVSEIGGISLFEKEHDGRLRRELIFGAYDDGTINVTFQFMGSGGMDYLTFLEECKENSIQHAYELPQTLKEMHVSEGDIFLSGEFDGKLGHTSHSILLSADGGFVTGTNFVPGAEQKPT